MKKSELNDIIVKKIDDLDDSSEMKSFLMLILENELKNIQAAKVRYSSQYMELADKMSQEEQKHVDIRNKT